MDTLSGEFVKIILYTFWKGVYSKRKEIALHGSDIFPFREDPISKGVWCAVKKKVI